MTVVDRLLSMLRSDDPSAREEAALTFARFLQQGPPQAQAQPMLEWTVGLVAARSSTTSTLSVVDDDGGDEWEDAIAGLCEYIRGSEYPEPLVVYSIGRTRDERVMTTLLDLLRRTARASDETSQHSAYQALVALSDFPAIPTEAIALGVSSRSDGLREYALSMAEST
jgi:hypothetical protein